MTDNEITREKTFSEELPYFKERIKEVFDNYDNPDGYADVLYLSALSDSHRIVRKAEEEINRQQAEIERLKRISVSPSKDLMDFCGVLCDYAEELIDKAKAEAYKEFAEHLKERWSNNYYDSPDVDFDEFVDNFLKEMVGEEK